MQHSFRKPKVVTIFGTGPEAIKLFPVIRALSKRNALQSISCVAAQHREILDQVLDIADIKPDYDLDLMRADQNLDELTGRLLTGIGRTLDEIQPQRVVVQGDTATGAVLIDIDEALESCSIMITLTDHDMFKSIPLDERAGKVVYDTRGIWPDQPDNLKAATNLRLAS